MELSEIAIIISIIGAVVAIVGALFNFWYTRREFNLKITEFNTKRSFENIITIISDNIKQIKDKITYFPYYLTFLDLATTDILTNIHDNKLSSLNIKITIIDYEIWGKDINDIREINDIKKGIFETFKERSKSHVSYSSCIIKFATEPNNIIQNKEIMIELIDYLSDLYYIYDNTLMEDYEKTLDSIIQMLINIKDKRIINIEFKNEDTSMQIYKKLENSFIDMEKVKEKINHIETILIPKLNIVQKEMLNKI